MPPKTLPFKRYIIDVYGDENCGQYATVRNEGKDDTPSMYINNSSEIDSIALAVSANSTFLKSNLSDDNQVRYIEMIGMNLADSILEKSNLIFDPDPRYAYDGLQTKARLDSGDCTYILEHVQYPAMWKIGFTSNLYERTETLYHENNKIPVKLIALFQTSKNFELETYLHMAFASYRKTGEWFQFKPIERWINFYKSNVQSEPQTTQQNSIIEPYIW